MFTKEFNVEGKAVKGRIIGNYSKDSAYAFKITDISLSPINKNQLDILITELTQIRDKVNDMNNGRG